MSEQYDVPPALLVGLRRQPPKPTWPHDPSPPRKPRSTVCVRSIYTPCTGYGQVAEWLGRCLERVGHRVVCQDYGYDPEFYEPSPWVRERLDHDLEPDWILHVATPDMPPERSIPFVHFTMWETTGLPSIGPVVMNDAKAVLTPSHFNVQSFLKAGIRTPIYRVPLGVCPSEGYYPRPLDMDGPTVFGMAARLQGGGVRKGVQEGIEAFLAAFPDDPDVRLRIKLWPDCAKHVAMPRDPRIEVCILPLRSHEMAWWYAGLTVLLVPSKGEGWGLHTQQAMACGRPVIASRVTGTAEFFDGSCGWEVPYATEPAGGRTYQNVGEWFVPNKVAMMAAMQSAHADRGECAAKGVKAAARALEHTWNHTATALDDVLARLGLVPRVVG